MSDLKDILHKLGYTNLQDSGSVYRTKPLYRDSGNESILCIFKNSGYFTDHGRENLKGPLEELVRLTLNLKNIKEAAAWLGTDYKKLKSSYQEQVKYVEVDRIFDNENLNLMIKNHEYWNKRNISNDVLNNFLSGVDDGVEGGKMYNRYVFPIFDFNSNIIGFSGRKLEKNSKRPKWIHYGSKSKWIYPAFLNEADIKEKKEVRSRSIRWSSKIVF